MRTMVHRGGEFLSSVIVLTVVWCIWNESFAGRTVTEGAIFSAVAVFVTNRWLLKGSYFRQYAIGPFTVLRYLLVVVVAIFRSGFDAIRVTLTGRLNVGIVDIPTEITDPFRAVLVANAITLTPGTVTIEHSPGSFKVVWIDCVTHDPEEAGEMIKGNFESTFLQSPVSEGEVQ